VDSREAREILACYRPGFDGAGDPRLAEALALARRDSALARWLDQQIAFDGALHQQFRGIAVPADLREKILAGRQPASRARAAVSWRPTAWRAIAAGLAAVAVIAGLWLTNRRDSFNAYRQEMAGLVSGEYEIKFRTKHFDEIRDYLASHGSPSDYALSPALRELEAEGVSVIPWRGQKVSLICLEAGEDHDLFLFVVPRSVLKDAPVLKSPQISSVGGMTTAAWSAGDKVYFLAAHGDEQFLRRYL